MFPVESILDNSTTDFDLFIELAGKLTVYARSPYKWNRDELSRLLADGHKVLYYYTRDQARAEAYRAMHAAIAKVDLSLPPAGRIVNLTDAAAELTKVLYEHPVTIAAMERLSDIAASMVDTLEEDRTVVGALGKLANHDHYTYYHSARVSAYAVAIAIQLSLTDREHLREMATGALLHDVGKSKVDLAVLNKRGALTKEDWALMRQHPVFGGELVDESMLAHMPREIILHHHERFDGTGYPHNLTERELLEEVKIVAFADVFDALTTNRPYQVSRSRFEALDLIRHKMLSNVHRQSFEAMVAILGHNLKPPKPDES